MGRKQEMIRNKRGEPVMVYSEARGKNILFGYRNEMDRELEKSRKGHQEIECANPEVHDCPGCEHRPDCAHCLAVGVPAR